MSRWEPFTATICYNEHMRIAAVFITVILLSGCYIPEPYVPPLPIEYSFTDPNKPLYPRTHEGARIFLEDVREPHWNYEDNDYAQWPDTSYRELSGDCDDFAIMLAFYLQEYWEYDTFVLILRKATGPRAGHAVCCIRTDDLPQSFPESLICGAEPSVTWSGVRWRPLDWTPCPDWYWDTYEIGAPLRHLGTGDICWIWGLEWDQTFNYAMSYR